ncbi:MAG: EamA family transporter [Acidobacteria bacterium]|nr:EamA family transporter [Acidobacteriota bacterium]
MAATARVNAPTAGGAPSPINSLHALGVTCGLGAGVWLGAAEAPVKLVNSGLSPFAVSLCMVAGVFVARWTFPTMLKGTSYVFADLFEKKHLIIWALLAGSLWAVANTLTVFAIRDVGLAVAFPLWNANSLIGLLWGWLLFGELRGAGGRTVAKVVIGAVAIVAAAILLGFTTIHGSTSSHRAVQGVAAALGASLLWGTMYVPYRKVYISGMNPLSFVTAFTVGELGTMLALVLSLDGGTQAPVFHSAQVRPMLFWLFLGGFVWVIGDLLQQFAVKYVGIGRGIPLSNTNQLWGLAWGVLVFGEFAGAGLTQKLMVITGSGIMVLGAIAISSAVAGQGEIEPTRTAVRKECDRYNLEYDQVLAQYEGSENKTHTTERRWWDYLILLAGLAIFIVLASQASTPALAMNIGWAAALSSVLVIVLGACAWLLWRLTKFS